VKFREERLGRETLPPWLRRLLKALRWRSYPREREDLKGMTTKDGFPFYNDEENDVGRLDRARQALGVWGGAEGKQNKGASAPKGEKRLERQDGVIKIRGSYSNRRTPSLLGSEDQT